MAVKIRLARGGAKKQPHYKVVVANALAPRNGKFLEKVGTYNPMLQKDSNERVILKADRIEYWLSVGAKPTKRVASFIEKAGLTLPNHIQKKITVQIKNRKPRLSKKES